LLLLTDAQHISTGCFKDLGNLNLLKVVRF
jgi:hypothetical protein